MSRPRRPAPAQNQPGSPAGLRQALLKRTKSELVDFLMDLAQTDQRVVRQLTVRFEVPETPIELIAATHQAIADATALGKGDLDYDDEAYAAVKRNLDSLIASGHLRPAMELALELMRCGSEQVEMSDEGLMTDDIESGLKAVIEAVAAGDLSREESLAWCNAMLAADRVGFIAERPLKDLLARLQVAGK